jgi:hypothetical protein
MQRFQQAFDEMKQAVDLDANNLDARVKLGNYYVANSGQSSSAVSGQNAWLNKFFKKIRTTSKATS